MPDINGIPYVDSTDLVSGWPATSQSVAQEVSDQLASKIAYPSGGADGNVLTKSGTAAAWTAISQGKILQVVRDTDTTDRTTTSTSYVDLTGLSVSITPQFATSAVIVICTLFAASSGASTSMYGQFQIADGSNNPQSGAESMSIGRTNPLGDLQVPITLVAYVTPATTSAITFKARFRSQQATTTTYAFNSLSTGAIYAIEVAA